MHKACNHIRIKQKPSYNWLTIVTGLHDQLRQAHIVAGNYVLTRDFVSRFHCVIGTRYWYQLNLIEKTKCLQQYCSPEQDLTLGLSGIAIFEDCTSTALTTQPPRLVYKPPLI